MTFVVDKVAMGQVLLGVDGGFFFPVSVPGTAPAPATECGGACPAFLCFKAAVLADTMKGTSCILQIECINEYVALLE
jgi:hypothetical protein